MLENPSDESVVRWGNDGDSFVVLEVRLKQMRASRGPVTDHGPERKIHKAHITQTLQTQQLCELCPTIEQI
jgi:hypothetical protein